MFRAAESREERAVAVRDNFYDDVDHVADVDRDFPSELRFFFVMRSRKTHSWVISPRFRHLVSLGWK